MPSDMKYRDEVKNELMNVDKKKFLSILPTGSRYITIFFMSLVVFFCVLLLTVKVPLKMKGTGTFVSGYSEIPVFFDSSNFLVKEVYVSSGEKVIAGQPIYLLSLSHQPGNVKKIEKLKHDIDHQKINYDKKNNEIKNVSVLNEKIIEQQEIIYKSVLFQLNNAKSDEAEGYSHFKKGFSNKQFWVDKKERVNQLQTKVYEFDASKLAMIKNHSSELISMNDQMASIEHSIDEHESKLIDLQDIVIKSPCDCVIDNTFLQKEQLTESGRVIATLLKNNKGKMATVYISSKVFKPIGSESKVVIKPNAYPTLKYGAILGKVNSISKSTVSGKHYPELFDSLSHYFKINVEITHLPDSIKLESGMKFESEIITGHLSLLEFIFE
jgi:multidrug resistance efflux pump